ncbi:MarR family winged helix-turn-helix transcriptional regulator [Cellulomonas sp. URHE0023]|uniref:MarR family winged helix-turn-helix transcriptional regulator n=1 Tax=Cellulomonas sp. URHE0023 TaxID=1380354 RepID=UPI00068F4C9B|nr:MarR family winged helix-turn-helix transcriptional regulator [Cellulomonas sp. URHE0023]
MTGAEEFAKEFEDAFQKAYLRFHRRDGKGAQMSGASRAVLMHLAHTGPLTVGEAAQHLDRAQSVVSDIVTQLESKNLLERDTDPDDRRRTLVWLTPSGFDALDRERQVLSTELLARAGRRMTPEQRAALVGGLHALNQANEKETTP